MKSSRAKSWNLFAHIQKVLNNWTRGDKLEVSKLVLLMVWSETLQDLESRLGIPKLIVLIALYGFLKKLLF